MKLPRKLKKKVKKESLKQQRVKALEVVGKACATAICVLQVYKILGSTKPKFPPGGNTYASL